MKNKDRQRSRQQTKGSELTDAELEQAVGGIALVGGVALQEASVGPTEIVAPGGTTSRSSG